MTINERITVVRKGAGLNKGQFGERIGLRPTQAGAIEKPGHTVTPRVAQLICNAFGVSEKWLVKGEGKMYTSDEDAILEKLSNMYDLTPEQEIFARHWLQLPPDAREAVVDYVVGVVESIKENQDMSRTEPGQDSDNQKDAPFDASAQAASPPVAVFKSPAQPNAPVPAAAAPVNAPVTAHPADDATHTVTVSDEELEVVQMMRKEKSPISGSSSCTTPKRA